MKEYKKPQIIAKNLPTGSYAAGCPSKDKNSFCLLFDSHYGARCEVCERTK